jgi:type IV pilus assembly protein PilB
MMNNNKMNLGQLLLRQGVLDEDQLAHAMAEHKRTGLMLSKILVRLGMVSEETLTNILGSQMQSSTKMRIGEMLLAQGYITQEQLDKALETQKTSGKRLGRTLVDLGYMPEERLIEILSRQFEVPYVKLDNFNIDPNAFNYLPEDMCKQYKVVPLFVQKGEDERRQVRSSVRGVLAVHERMVFFAEPVRMREDYLKVLRLHVERRVEFFELRLVRHEIRQTFRRAYRLPV